MVTTRFVTPGLAQGRRIRSGQCQCGEKHVIFAVPPKLSPSFPKHFNTASTFRLVNINLILSTTTTTIILSSTILTSIANNPGHLFVYLKFNMSSSLARLSPLFRVSARSARSCTSKRTSCQLTNNASYTTSSQTSASSSAVLKDGSKRYLQTATVHRPSNLLENGVPPPRNMDAPSSSLTNTTSFQSHPAPPPAAPTPQATPSSNLTGNSSTVSGPVTPFKASRLRAPRKAAMTLTGTAVTHLRELLDQPEPKLIRVGVKNRGCSGLAYNLEYVDKPGKFDEVVVQDGVKVLIDSKALFSIIGSEMDWVEDKLSARFVFKNPNISKYNLYLDRSKWIINDCTLEEQCGCGESFMVGN